MKLLDIPAQRRRIANLVDLADSCSARMDAAPAAPGPAPAEPAPAPTPPAEPAPAPQPGPPPSSAAPDTYTALLASLPESQRALVLAEVGKKNSEAKNLRDRNKELEPKAKAHDDALEAQRSAEEKAEQRAKAAEDRAHDANMRAVRAEVYAAASDTYANPGNAAPLLGDLSGYVDSNGVVTAEQIKTDVAELLDANPHLGKPQNTAPRPPAPNPGQGGNAPTGKSTGTDAGREMFQTRRGRKPAPATT